MLLGFQEFWLFEALAKDLMQKAQRDAQN